MDRPKFFLNPNAEPFIPNLKRASKVEPKEEYMVANVMFCDYAAREESELRKTFDPAWQPAHATDKLLVSDEDFSGRDYQVPEPEDLAPQYETMGIEKQQLEDGFQMELEYLFSLFPSFSFDSVREVYRACGDVVEAKLMLEHLEGHDDSSHSLPDDQHSRAASSSGCHNDVSSDSVSPADSEAIHRTDSANMGSA